jgi:hypothetical protein
MNTQNYANHGYTPKATGIGFLLVVVSLVFFGLRFFQIGALHIMSTIAMSCLIAAVIDLLLISRLYTTRLQDRIIKLEMKVRCATLLSPAQQAALGRLTTPQIVALRFACDAELPPLLERAEREHLSAKQIKQSIKEWVADWDRT